MRLANDQDQEHDGQLAAWSELSHEQRRHEFPYALFLNDVVGVNHILYIQISI